jgi:hypothetical protein
MHFKMKKMILIIGALVVIVFLLFKYNDHLPPRTPLKIARIQSGLDIPKDIQIIDFKEEYSFSGEGFIYVLLKLDDKDLDYVTKECIKNKYSKLTIDNLVTDKLIHSDTKEYGYTVYDKDITSIKEGYYKLNAIDLNKRDFTITVIDEQKKELIIYISIP